jgi:hypothetical protein
MQHNEEAEATMLSGQENKWGEVAAGRPDRGLGSITQRPARPIRRKEADSAIDKWSP